MATPSTGEQMRALARLVSSSCKSARDLDVRRGDCGHSLGAAHGGHRPFARLNHRHAAVGKRDHAVVLVAGLPQRGLGLRHAGEPGRQHGAAVRDLRVEAACVELGERLEPAHGAVSISQNLAHGAGQFDRDLDERGGLDRTAAQ
jgi:hypothetical protein